MVNTPTPKKQCKKIKPFCMNLHWSCFISSIGKNENVNIQYKASIAIRLSIQTSIIFCNKSGAIPLNIHIAATLPTLKPINMPIAPKIKLGRKTPNTLKILSSLVLRVNFPLISWQ